MKIHIYDDEQMTFFPLYAATVDIDFPQPITKRPCGYHMHQIFLISSGTGVLHIENKTLPLEEGDLFFVSANIPHSYSGTDKSFSTTYLSFCGSGFDNIKRYYGLEDFGLYKNKSRGKFSTSAEKLYELIDTAPELSSLCALTFSTVIAFFDEACKKEYSPIENVYNYIETNYSKMITLDDILTVYPYSKAKLCRDFKERYQSTIFEALTNIRLRHARYMLSNNPNLKLKAAASSCGFNDVSYFCKMYRRLFGNSPKAENA